MAMLNPVKKWCTRNINRHVNPIKKNDAIEI